ncbi:hypothetical protein ABW21_db0209084 [Orbilia brochopaga]|nr:hypothetical protein ABW21_db0209084 [Drechslerella brochopaga]
MSSLTSSSEAPSLDVANGGPKRKRSESLSLEEKRTKTMGEINSLWMTLPTSLQRDMMRDFEKSIKEQILLDTLSPADVYSNFELRLTELGAQAQSAVNSKDWDGVDNWFLEHHLGIGDGFLGQFELPPPALVAFKEKYDAFVFRSSEHTRRMFGDAIILEALTLYVSKYLPYRTLLE